MKFLIAFAFVAAASAVSYEPVELPEAPMPEYEIADIRPLFVPEEVVRQVRLAEEKVKVTVPVNSEDGLIVQFVDLVPSDYEVQEDSEQPQPIIIVDSPLEEVYEDSEQPINSEDVIVKVVDFDSSVESSVDEVQEDSERSYAVKIVDSPLEVNENVEQPQAVNVVDSPLDQQVPVESVKAADIPPRYPSKIYSDPMWR